MCIILCTFLYKRRLEILIRMKRRAYKKTIDKLVAIEKITLVILLFANIVLTAGNVFSRYVIHKSWSFTEEIVVAMLVLMSLVGAALCARERGGLINLTLFTDKFSKFQRMIVEIAMTLLLVCFALVMVKYGYQRCLTQIETGRLTSSLQIPEWYYSAFVPISGILIAIHGAERILDLFFEYTDFKKESDRSDNE